MSLSKRWDLQELRMPGCVRIADCDEHTAEAALTKSHTKFRPEFSEGPRMIGGNHLLEEVASRRHETLGFVLKCSDPRGPPSSTQYARVS